MGLTAAGFCRFQLLGIACLREAMGDTRRRLPIRLSEQDKNLDPARFAFISDRTYTVEEVEQATRTVAESVPDEIRDAPNGKMFLRSFWYRGVAALITEPEEMHIYTVARCVLSRCCIPATVHQSFACKLINSAEVIRLELPTVPMP